MGVAKNNLYCFNLKAEKKTRKVNVLAVSYEAALEGLGFTDGEVVTYNKNAEMWHFIMKPLIPRKVSPKELASFFKGLSRGMKSGLAIPSAIKLNASLIKSEFFKGVLGQIGLLTGRKGYTLSEAFSEFPNSFTPMIISLVKAGEKTGNLEPILFDLGIKLEKSNKVMKSLLAGLYYPGFIMLMTIGGFFGASYYVIPQLTRNFKSFDIELPLITQFFIAFSDILHEQWLFLPSMLGVLILLFKFRKKIIQSRVTQTLALKVPVIGPLLHATILARCLDALAMLLKSGCDILTAYTIVQDVAGNVIYKDYFGAILTRLKRGEHPESAYMKETDRIGENGFILANQVKLSSFSGDMDVFMTEISQNLTEESEIKIKELPKLIQPILMGVVSIFIGLLVAAIYLPNFYMLEGVMK